MKRCHYGRLTLYFMRYRRLDRVRPSFRCKVSLLLICLLRLHVSTGYLYEYSFHRRIEFLCKTVLAAAEELELTANYLSAGVESNLLLAVDSIFPKPVLFSAISRFSEHFPHTQIDIEESFRLMPDDDATCDLSITVSQGGITPGPKLIDVTVVPVAHHQHPIFSNREGEISKEALTLSG